MNTTSRCLRCHRPVWMTNRVPKGGVRHAGRGLCPKCHDLARRNNSLDDYPLNRGRTADVIERYTAAAAQHPEWNARQIADHIGHPYTALRQAISRHRRTTTTTR